MSENTEKTDQGEETSDKKRNRTNLEPFIKMWEPKLEPPHVKSWLIGKDPDAGRD